MSGTGGGSGGGTPQVDILALGVDTGPLKQAEGEVAKSLSRVEGAAEGAAQAFDQFEKSVLDAAAAAKTGATAAQNLDAATTGAGAAAKGATTAQVGLSAASKEGAAASKGQAAAIKALEAELAEARRMMIAMGATIADMNKAMDALQKQAAGAGKAQAGMASAATAAAGAYGLTTREIQQLLPQINDVFTQLSMGQGLLMTATAQGPQIIQQLGGIGNTLNALGRFAGSFIQTGTGLTVAFAAIGVAAIAMSESTDRALSNLSQRLRMTREDYEALSVAVTETAKRVAVSSSIGTGDAREAGRVIASQRNFSGSEAELESLVRLSGRLARAMGVEVPEAAATLARAIDKPADAARRLASEGLRTMDEALVRNVISLENQGKVLEAGRLVTDAYRRALEEASKTPLQQSLENLGNAFQRLMQALRPIIDAIGSALAYVLSVAVDWTAKLVDGLSRVIELATDNRVTQFLGLAPTPREPVAATSSGRQATEEAMRRVREINPRVMQRQAINERITSLQAGLPEATAEESRLIAAGVDALREQLRGIQGPMEQYLKGLRQQVDVARQADGANRAVAQALIAVENAGGGAAEQGAALILVRRRLAQEFANENAALSRSSNALLSQAEAQAQGARAAEESRIAAQAYLETLQKFQPGDERFETALATRVGLLLRERDVREQLRNAQNLTAQEQQLELLRTEIDLVGQSVVQREREIAALRERQRIQNEGGDPASSSSQARIANAERIAEATQALQRQQSAFNELARIGEQAFDRIGEAITQAFATGNMKALNFRNIAKAVFSEVLQWMLRLAVINPLKNSFGGNQPTLFNVASVFGVGGGGGLGGVTAGSGGATDAGGLQGGLNQLGQLGALRSAGSFGNLQNAFTNQGPAMTGFSWLDGALNTTLWGGANAGINAGGAVTNAAGYGSMAANAIDAAGSASAAGVGSSTMSLAGGLGGAAGIAGGAYSIYSGIQRGGIGGAVGVAGGAASAIGGAMMLAGMAGGPIGLIAGAIAAVVASMLPGAKESSSAQGAEIGLADGTVSYEGNRKNFSQANRDEAEGLARSVASLETKLEQLVGFSLGGRVNVGVDSSRRGDRANIFFRYQETSRTFDRTEEGAKQLAEAAAETFFRTYQQRADDLMNSDVLGRQVTQTDLDRRSILRASSSAENLEQNLEWYEKTYKAMVEAGSAANEYAKSIEAAAKPYNDAIEKARALGLAEDALARKRDEATQRITSERDREVSDISSSIIARAVDADLWGGNEGAVKFWNDMNAAAVRAAAEVEDLRIRLDSLGVSSENAAGLIQQLQAVQAAETAKRLKARNESITDIIFEVTRRASATGMLGDAGTLTQYYESWQQARSIETQVEALAKQFEDLGWEAAYAGEYIERFRATLQREADDANKARGMQIWETSVEVNRRAAAAGVLGDAGAVSQAHEAMQTQRSIDLQMEALRKQFEDLGWDAENTAIYVDRFGQALKKEAADIEASRVRRVWDSAIEVNRRAAVAGLIGDAGSMSQVFRDMQEQRSIEDQVDALRKQFIDLGFDVENTSLYVQRFSETLQKEAQDRALERIAQVRSINDNADLRLLRAAGRTDEAALMSFDIAARDEIAQLRKALIDLGVGAAEAAATIGKTEQALTAERVQLVNQLSEATREATRQAGRSIRAYLDELRTSTGAGGVSGADALAAAQQQFGRDLTLARDGDQEALSRITTSADRLLSTGQAQYASGADFQAIRTFVLSSLENLPATRSYDSLILDELKKLGGGIDVAVDIAVVRTITEALNLLPEADRARLVQAQLVLRSVEERLGRFLTAAEKSALVEGSLVRRDIEQAMARDLTPAERTSLVTGGQFIREVEQRLGRNLTPSEVATLVASEAVQRVVEQSLGRDMTAAERAGLVQAGSVERRVEQILQRDLTESERALIVSGGTIARNVSQSVADPTGSEVITPGSVNRTVTQTVETIETVQISRSIDDKLSGILNAMLVVGREQIVAMTAIGTEANGHTRRMSEDLNLLWRTAAGVIGSGLVVQARPWAQENASSIVKFAQGGVFDGPVLFPMRRGTGMLGEAGPEAIMPLQRAPDGSLGVRASGDLFDLSPIVRELRDLRREVAYLRAERDADAKRAQRTREDIADSSGKTAEATEAVARDRGAVGRRRKVA